jgi:hypothetical protein
MSFVYFVFEVLECVCVGGGGGLVIKGLWLLLFVCVQRFE